MPASRSSIALLEQRHAEAVDPRALERARDRGRAVPVGVGLEHRPDPGGPRVPLDDAQVVPKRLEVDLGARRPHRVGGSGAARAEDAGDERLGHRWKNARPGSDASPALSPRRPRGQEPRERQPCGLAPPSSVAREALARSDVIRRAKPFGSSSGAPSATSACAVEELDPVRRRGRLRRLARRARSRFAHHRVLRVRPRGCAAASGTSRPASRKRRSTYPCGRRSARTRQHGESVRRSLGAHLRHAIAEHRAHPLEERRRGLQSSALRAFFSSSVASIFEVGAHRRDERLALERRGAPRSPTRRSGSVMRSTSYPRLRRPSRWGALSRPFATRRSRSRSRPAPPSCASRIRRATPAASPAVLS